KRLLERTERLLRLAEREKSGCSILPCRRDVAPDSERALHARQSLRGAVQRQQRIAATAPRLEDVWPRLRDAFEVVKRLLGLFEHHQHGGTIDQRLDIAGLEHDCLVEAR